MNDATARLNRSAEPGTPEPAQGPPALPSRVLDSSEHQMQWLAAFQAMFGFCEVERRLREERDFSEAALNGLSGVFYHFSEDGTFLRWNRNLEAVSGYSAQELAGMRALDFFTDEDKPRVAAEIAALYNKGHAEIEANLRTKDGRLIPYLFNGTVFEQGNQRGVIGVALDISERKLIEQKLRDEYDFSTALLDSLPGIFYRYDENQRLIRWNKNFETVTGYSAEELAFMNPFRFFLSQEWGLIASEIEKVFSQGHAAVEANFLLKNGATIPYLFTGVQLTYRGKANFVGIGIDITERKMTEDALREKTALLEAQIESSADGILILDGQGRRLVQNKRLNELWRIPAEVSTDPDSSRQLAHIAAQSVQPGDFLAKMQWLDQHPDEITRDEIELLDGTFLDRYSAPVRDQQGNHYGRIWTFRDITESRLAQRHISHLAHYDVLTGLPNRHTFQTELEERLSGAGEAFALLFIDLDGFKIINDTKGHRVGDEMLQRVADRLRLAFQDPGMFVARLGGDEFAGVIPGVDVDRALAFGASVVEALSAPFHCEEDRRLQIGASIGIVLTPDHGADAETLLSRADIALYSAKEAGKGMAQMFSAEMENRMYRKLYLEMNLRAALESEEGLFVFYQPITAVETGKVTAREALVRWYLPESGWISPSEFIPVAERSGMIDRLGLFVLNRACHDAVQWEDQSMRVAVNISPNQLGKGTLATVIRSVLDRTGLAPDRLEIEVTETALLDDEQTTIADLRDVRKLGVHVALDDFGTGYSSLAHLRLFPFDKIKIDGSFVRDALNQPECAAVVRAVADLGRRLGVTTVAEGVETQAHLDCIRAEGCCEYQGYYYGRPSPSEQDAPIVTSIDGNNPCEPWIPRPAERR